MAQACPFCESRQKTAVHVAREMMFGMRDTFEYAECADCRSIWLATPISTKEMSRYYGNGYYSYEPSREHPIRRWLLRRRNRAELGDRTTIGRLLAARYPETTMRMIGVLALRRDARILDVGCGGGRLLDLLADAGFQSLSGIDPYIDRDQLSVTGRPISKLQLSELSGRYDLIMFHHSLEHTPDPFEALVAARRRLDAGGLCLVRIPTVSSHAWEHFGTDWAQLDAPRHITIPSRAGMSHLARRAGFELVRTIDDSTPFQFEGSERYRADVPLIDHDFPIPPEDHARNERESARLNAEGRGDQAGFVLRA